MGRLLRLAEARVGGTYRVVRVEADGAVKRRMLDMGLSPGTVVKVVGFAPLGDPIDIVVRGTNVSIRRSEAAAVIVEEVEESGEA